MKQVSSINIDELKKMAESMYGSMVKADVDLEKGIVLVDMEMHADGEAYLLDNGSKQTNLWGINLHPSKYDTNEFIEFDSMINMKPSQDNPTRYILNEDIRSKIVELVSGVVHD
jgi:hypothetical protein